MITLSIIRYSVVGLLDSNNAHEQLFTFGSTSHDIRVAYCVQIALPVRPSCAGAPHQKNHAARNLVVLTGQPVAERNWQYIGHGKCTKSEIIHVKNNLNILMYIPREV